MKADSPRFRVGDEVRWGAPRGEIVLGPYAPGVKLTGGAVGAVSEYCDYTYVVRFGDVIQMLTDGVLTPALNWVLCPGDHRALSHTVDGAKWERVEP
jgi:hypothetical protein